MRQATACATCCARRRKCEADISGQPCTWCSDRNLKCSNTDDKISESSVQHPQNTFNSINVRSDDKQSQASTVLPPRVVCNELISLYFQYIHDTSHSIFHRSSLMEDLASGKIPSVILYAIIGLSARFSDNSFFASIDPRLRGRPYIRESERLLNLRGISLSTIQACILIGPALSSEGDAATEAVYYSIACRNAMFLNLPNPFASTALNQELQIRGESDLHCDGDYQYLHEDCFDDALQSRAHEYAEKCKAHSIALCNVLYCAYSTTGSEVYYTMVGHVLVIASTVQLHILLFSADAMEVDAAKERLQRNFQILTKLQSYWPTLDVCFEHFRQFHDACHKSREQSFRMDRWMLQFLFEFARPVGERDANDFGDIEPWSIESLATFGLDGIDEKLV